jgi:hypothetical protein
MVKATPNVLMLLFGFALAFILSSERSGTGLPAPPAHAADEMPAEIIAVQIREQGYSCDEALSAKREHPELDDAVWILKCNNASYRVRLIPDMAAKVERLD